MTLPFGIDISKHQGVNNYAKIKANTAFVFVKATESWGYTDPKFYQNWAGLIGHNRGAYSFVWLSDDPLRQANHLIDIVLQAGADWKYDRLVLDLEKSGHGLSKAEVTRRVLVMMERIREVTGRYPALYSRKYWVQDNMLINDPRLANADWWLAYFRKALPYPLYTPEMPSPPLMPNGVNRWLIHQTCEKGKGKEVGVGSYYVDQDRWNGTREDVDAYFGRAEAEQPEPDPEPLFQARVYSWATPYVNVRAQPSIHSGKVGIKRPLDVVDVYEVLKDWYKIQGGYIMSRFLERLDYQEPPSLMAVPLYSQRDLRWASDLMGSSGITLGAEGCLVTCTAAGLTYLGYPIDPKEYNRLASTRGGYAPPNKMYWMFPDVITNNAIKRNEYRWISGGVGWEQYVDPILDDKRPVWAEVRLNGRQHWVLIIGKADGAYWILDPWHGDVVDMSSRYDRVYRIVSYRRQQ